MKINFSLFIFFLIVFLSQENNAVVRIILSTDTNPNYIQFWPICAKMWSQIIGARPTLALIAPKDTSIDTTLGDVIRFEPIPDISTALQAQCIRLLLPALFPEDICITGDIDSLPLQKNYFLQGIHRLRYYSFISYNGTLEKKLFRLRICWNVALGKTFGEIFKVKNRTDIVNKLVEWSSYGLGWPTDEFMLSRSIENWLNVSLTKVHNVPHRFLFLNNRGQAIRQNMKYNQIDLRKGIYTHFHCPRPYSAYKETIDEIAFISLRIHR